ncbi:hypothetical protein BOTBODRAFT_70091 [Botryobasidium botryosum FD-172 SS1]|uniref:AP complex subunit beta n=1 Tax=Botryobasidium botryosum (strain FD-172 SS1) TaxID=930990 RepID=A0A067LZW9_BOTB1|nr:hypothetical protein BOTBODRAFT_70091 [Botryobasidium botryosum FD-172 SS1]
MASDAKFFTKGKIQEFRKELEEAESKDKKFAKRKTVLKKIVANITMGNDMSPLFPDVIRCMSIQVLEIKKMVYLYLVSYGRVKPDQIQHAVVHFLTDCNDRNPLIRALAIRTMSYIPLPIVINALTEPLRHCLRDSDPYVRKTAAICVAKLYMHDPRVVDKQGFIENLRTLLADNNPTVVANAVAALTEISERSETVSLKLNLSVASKLISALGECSEWGQIYILDSLLSFVPQTSADAEMLAERISIRLQHANSAVVLTTIKILLYLMNYIDNGRLKDLLCKKMGPPLVTLLSSGPEVQYVALRNILLIIQRRPAVLKNDVKVFFCKYNDPIYVKLAKLEIMYRLAREENCKAVLAELEEYASEVDVDFVRKAVRTIGRLAIKLSAAADLCITALLSLLETKIAYVVQEVVVVVRDIFRRYPMMYENVIPTLCEHLDDLTEPEAKAAMIWVVGHYAERIDNAVDLLEDLSDNFKEETTEVQLSLLTAVVKLFIQRPDDAKELVSKILKWATEEVDNPDLRDRGFMYWRLLSTDAGAARDVVLSEKPPISTETDRMDRGALDQLLLHTATLGSIYHKNPETFIRTARGKALTDSPALNPASRAVLVSVVEPAKGPVVMPDFPEPRPADLMDTADQEAKSGSSDAVNGSDLKAAPTPAPASNAETNAPSSSAATEFDPYAGLDSVFRGGYVTDAPAPMKAQGEDGDLLFF